MDKTFVVLVSAFIAFAAFGGGSVVVDIGADIGPVKPLHGVCNGPWDAATRNIGNDRTRIRQLEEIGVPFVRLHDTGGIYGGAYFVDVSNIFRDFDRDENDPASYDFALTDLYIAEIVKAGAEVFYRLGETIDHGVVKRRTSVPRDFAKWARICEHIVAHYNEGWAGGHKWNIRYWEIWNEPNNPLEPNPQWDGTPEQFYELYATAATYLKKRFPDIRIGGSGEGYVTGSTRRGARASLAWCSGFMKYIAERGAPYDFLDIHLYTRDPDEFAGSAATARALLNKYGYVGTELVVGEWNNGAESSFVKNMASAAMCAASFKVMHDAGIELSCYYQATPKSAAYCGLFNWPGPGCAKPYYAFKAYGELRKLGRLVKVESPRDDIYALAARNGDRVAVLLSRYTVDRLDWKPNYAFDEKGVPHPSSEPVDEAYLKRVEEADRTVAFNFELKGLSAGKDAVVTVRRLDGQDDLEVISKTTILDGCRSMVMTMRQPEVRLVEVELVPAKLSRDDAVAAAGFFDFEKKGDVRK